MPTDFDERIRRIRTRMQTDGVDTFLVLIEENRCYLSGFTGEDTQFDESAGALLITDSARILLTDTRFTLQAEREAPAFEVVTHRKGFAEELPAVLRRLETRRLGFESVRMTCRQYRNIERCLGDAALTVELVPMEDVVEDLRRIKDADEIERLRQALHLAESAFSEFLKELRPGITEREAAWRLEKQLREAGADALSFPVIVASGPNSALPHAIPSDRRIRTGEPVLFDWGARLNGFCSDISRTLIIGEADERFESVYRTVLAAQQQAISAVAPGKNGKEVDAAARETIDATEYKGLFGHGLGHGTGLAVHESPRLSPLKEDILAPGMVFTVEPGIYIPDWGGVRLEQMVVARQNGAEVLNRTDPATGYVLRA
jgi:Xaa-Pro aminopeptidase